MDAVHTYIAVLVDTLQKKKRVLEQIYDGTKRQKEILQNDKFGEDEFQKVIDEKSVLLAELEKLDNGFEQIFERIALILKHNKDMYKEEILIAQTLIREIMDLSISIQTMEEQNKERFGFCMGAKQKQYGSIRTKSKQITNYYKNMPNVHQLGQTYFLDKKIK